MTKLTRDDIVGAKILGVKEIEVPEWNGSVFIRKWSGKDRAKFLKASTKIQGEDVGANFDTIFDNMALVVVISLCDEDGVRLFADEDQEMLAEKDANAIQRIYEAVLVLNALNQTAVQDSAKNSDSIQNSVSTSDSQENSDIPETSSLNA